jgi:formiminotetrahydrofolate cyclodeaminase
VRGVSPGAGGGSVSSAIGRFVPSLPSTGGLFSAQQQHAAQQQQHQQLLLQQQQQLLAQQQQQVGSAPSSVDVIPL